jgi:2-polyprenyl-3-methyl-5-hydroxy-6-metoxy-1,4-benzoquinol methylase
MNEDEIQAQWDKEAATFDNEPDHGLRSPAIREAWTTVLMKWLPARADVLDVGCGTGSLSVVLSSLGHTVTGIDFSPAMIAQARAKADAAGRHIAFHVMNAADPQINQKFDVVLCRHVLWALHKPADVIQRWMKLLKPGGRLVLIEGFWRTGAGLHADDVLKMLPAQWARVQVENLSDQPSLWGRSVEDERYAVIADLFSSD